MIFGAMSIEDDRRIYAKIDSDKQTREERELEFMRRGLDNSELEFQNLFRLALVLGRFLFNFGNLYLVRVLREERPVSCGRLFERRLVWI